MTSRLAATADGIGRIKLRQTRLGGSSNRIGLAALAVVLVVYFEVSAGGFATFSNADSILLNVFPLLVAGIATGALLISGNVDLSIGGGYALTAVVTAAVAQETQSTAAAIGAGLGSGVAVGLLNGTLVRYLSISPLIVTLGTASVFHGLAFVVTDGTAIFGFPESFVEIGRTELLGVPLQVWIALAFFAMVSFVLMKTVFGLRTFAIGGNPDAARRNGINVDGHVTALYVLSGLSVAIAGVLTTAQLGSGTANLGIQFELDVLTAVILGGVAFNGGSGRPIGIFVGILTIGVLDAGMIFVGLADFYQQIAKGGILLLALSFDQYAEYRRRVHRRARAAPAPPQHAMGRNGRVATGRLGGDVSPRSSDVEPVFACAELSKRYGVGWANHEISFSVRSGEVLCLLGDNGAGKSTLIKTITGVVQPDKGEMWLNGKPHAAASPRAARKAGVAAVFQDLALCPNLGAAYNVVLGEEPRRGRLGPLSLVDNAKAVEITRERLDRLGVSLSDYFLPVDSLSGGQRQSVAIARVAADDVDLVILDEPTAALGVAQTRNVLELTRTLAQGGAAVVMISHDVGDVLCVADRVVVLHLGRVLFEGTIDEVDQSRLVHLMAGIRDVSDKAEPVSSAESTARE